MKTDAERMALIRQRTAQLQRQARARQMLLIDAGCMAACLVLVVCLGLAMPGWAGTSVALHVSPTGTAGMLSERGADGYILVGVLSFLLGSCVTILLYRLRRRCFMWPNAPGWPRISFFSRWRSSIGRACARRSRLLRWRPGWSLPELSCGCRCLAPLR